MWGVELPSETPFVYSIFGVQFSKWHPHPRQQSFSESLDRLISKSAKHVDKVEQEIAAEPGVTRIFLAYWQSQDEYQSWRQQEDVKAFWNSLPADAGVWREELTVSPQRTQHGTNKEILSGMGHLGNLKPNTDKFGYWRCYRDRMQDPDIKAYMSSPLPEVPQVARADQDHIHRGRVSMTKFPENLCFTVEGQDHSAITASEKNHWFENFDQLVTDWITYLDNDKTGKETGLLNTRLCYSPESSKYKSDGSGALAYNRKIELFYFLDMDHMLRSGMRHKGHVALRSKFLQSYHPEGPMGAEGQILLVVETSVLRGRDIQMEYIGCLEGTGLMRFRNHPAFSPSPEFDGQ